MNRYALTLSVGFLAFGAQSYAQDAPANTPAVPADQASAADASSIGLDTAHGSPSAAPTRTAQQRAMADRMDGRTPPIATAERDVALPAGTIHVTVVDAMGQPVESAAVRIGIMRQAGARDAQNGETDASGVFVARELPKGSDQAYRVSVNYRGAVYGAPPFRLESDHGHAVQIRRLETTPSQQMLLQVLGQTMLEYRDGRIHVIEQSRLSNLGNETIVFGEGLHYELPTGFTAFQSPAQMSDQRLVGDEKGFVLKGSMPPGTVTLTWAYDVPLDGEEARIEHAIPFATYRYRVFSDAAQSMRLDVSGFPAAEVHTEQGRRLLITQIERSREDSPLTSLSIAVRGIPGPGPTRWIALGAAFVLLLLGILLLSRGGRADQILSEARAARREELLEAAAELQRAHERGEVGPKYHSRRMEELVAELAALIRLDRVAETVAERTKR